MAFTNGNFETGTLAGWTTTDDGAGTHTHTSVASTAAAYAGNYGCAQTVTATNSGSYGMAKIYQLASTSFNSISFRYKVSHTNTYGSTTMYNYFTATIGVLNEYDEQTNYLFLEQTQQNEGDWITVTITPADIIAAGYHLSTSAPITISTVTGVY